eukprot:1134146-Amphidinium_carterae.1
MGQKQHLDKYALECMCPQRLLMLGRVCGACCAPYACHFAKKTSTRVASCIGIGCLFQIMAKDQKHSRPRSSECLCVGAYH